MLSIYIAVFLVLCLIFAGYLAFAYLSKPKRWPFMKKKVVNELKTYNGTMTTSIDEPATSVQTMGGIAFALVFILIIAFVIVGVYLSLKRYEIASQALKRGDTSIAAAALAPEIGQGIGNIFGTSSHRY